MGDKDTIQPDAALVNKGSNRIQVNNILSAVCLAALSVLLAQSDKEFSPWIIGQLGVAIPFLVTSSLAYAKLCYRTGGEVGADFVKTSTGYGDGGAVDDDLRLMRRCSPPHVRVKAAGGVRTFERLLAVRALGVSRVGATATKAILDECKRHLGL